MKNFKASLRSCRDKARRCLAEHGWLILGVAALVTFVFGIFGFRQLFLLEDKPYTWWDLAHLSLRLFRSEKEVPLGPKPWFLEIARTLAVIITFTAAFKALKLFFQEKLQRLWLWRGKDHVVICGLGEKGRQLAQDFLKRGQRVVIIDRDAGNDKLRLLQERGAIVLAGDATSVEQLKSAKAGQAKSLFAVTPNDWVNFEIALNADKLMASAGPNCFVHLVDNTLRDELRRLISGNKTQTTIKSFNIYENAARQLFRKHPPEITARELGQKSVHLLVIGFGRMGRSVALQIARIGHYDHGLPVRLTVLDQAAEARKKLFLEHEYPSFSKVCAIEFISLDVEDIGFLSGSFLAQIGGAASITQAIVCLEAESRAHVCALHLRRPPLNLACPIFVRASAETHPISLLAGEGLPPIQPFGAISATCEAGMVMSEEIDEEARQIHADYCKENRGKPGFYKDPAMQPWDDLDEDYRESNRANAEHLDIKLRAIGCKTTKLELDAKAAAFRFSDEEIERLAKMEHARWNAERFLTGWKLDKERDKEKKTSPYLVAWDELPEEIKDLDRNTVRELPDMLARLEPAMKIVKMVP